MQRTKKHSPPLTAFRHAVRVEVRRPEFDLLASVKQLDVAKLARAARAEFEVGYFEAGCCRRLVRAFVRKGKVTGLVAEPCESERPAKASPELARLLNVARRRAARRGEPPVRLPIPVADFVSNARSLTIRSITCVEICFFGFCFYCCNRPDDPNDWICGRSIVIINTF